MIVGPPSVIAMTPPTANLAMLDGFRIDIKDDGSRDGALETAPDVPVVRGIVGNRGMPRACSSFRESRRKRMCGSSSWASESRSEYRDICKTVLPLVSRASFVSITS